MFCYPHFENRISMSCSEVEDLHRPDESAFDIYRPKLICIAVIVDKYKEYEYDYSYRSYEYHCRAIETDKAIIWRWKPVQKVYLSLLFTVEVQNCRKSNIETLWDMLVLPNLPLTDFFILIWATINFDRSAPFICLAVRYLFTRLDWPNWLYAVACNVSRAG